MKQFIFFSFLFIHTASFCQEKDNIVEILDSLEKTNVYKTITYTEAKKLSFKPGEVPVYTEDEYKGRVEALNNFSPFKFSYNKMVRGYINRYLKNPKTVSYILQRSQFYFPLFEKYLNQYQIPLELKNLAIVESALNPCARSHCGATGLWQIMYGTGKSYHLDVNSMVDERYDPEKETIAACAYLSDLYKTYHNWPLALAAYNCGPGNVNKAIKKAGGNSDFWAIYDYLPKETQGYVPAFIAVCYVTTYYEEHNIEPVKNPMFWDNLDFIIVNERKSLKAIADELKMEASKIKYLNPQYFTGIIPGINSKVLIPVNSEINVKSYESLNLASVSSVNDIPKKEESGSAPISKFPVKAKSKFGTIYNEDSGIIAEQNVDFSNTLKASISVWAQAKDSTLIVPGKEFYLYNTEAFYYRGEYIKEDSRLITKASFINNSIILEVSIIKAFNKTVTIHLQGEILEKGVGKKDKGFIIEPKNPLLFKS